MVDFLIVISYVLMMFLPMFVMLVFDKYSEEQWEKKHHKRISDTLHDLDKPKKDR